MTDRFPTVNTAQIRRRTLVAGAAWSAPAILLATAAPAVAASVPPCKPVTLVTDWTSSSWMRTSATTGTYTWVNPLGNGSIPVLTLTVTASVVGSSFTSLASGNLTGTAGPTGGFSQPGLDLSLNLTKKTSNTTDTGADYLFAFSQPVTGLSTTITDIDGTYFNNTSSNSGAERVRVSSPSTITGTVANSSYLTGTGTIADPWRRRPNSTPNLLDLADTSNAGNVALSSPALSSFTVGFRLLDNTTAPPANYNIWLTPIMFTLLCP
jgi:hypothetical protein